MVKNHPHQIFKDIEGTPPPMDDSWWEAVLAEEEEIKFSSNNRRPPMIPTEDKPTPLAGGGLGGAEGIDWEHAMQLYQEDQAVELHVTGFNRGGLLVNENRLQGFVPISHLVDMPVNLIGEDQEQYLEPYVGRRLTLKVIECDHQRGRVVFSERAALAESGRRNTILGQLRPGECVLGTVTNVTDFGVFVDLGGVEGLIHVSEISWGRVRHPSDVVHVGDEVRVYVINVDPHRSRIALSLKRLCPNPWETAEERYFPGQVTEATITSIVPFGAFARLEEGLDGLIHVSEMEPVEGADDPLNAFSEGQHVMVRVLHVDAAKQRLGLSMQLTSAD